MPRSRRIFAGIATFALLSSFAFAGGPGGGGGGGGGKGGSGGSGGGIQAPPNPFVGEWIGGPNTTNIVDQSWDVTFKKDYTFTLVVLDRFTGVGVSHVGTYDFSLVAPDGYPVLTMVSGGEILLQMEFLFYEGALLLERGSGPFMEFGKKPSAD